MNPLTLNRGIGALKDGTRGTTAKETRLAFAQLLASDGGLEARAGVLPNPDLATALVTGKAGEWTYQVGEAPFVFSRGEADGVLQINNDSTAEVATTAAPGSDSRYDLIWVKHPSNGEDGDTDSVPLFGVEQGTAAAAPTKPYANLTDGEQVIAEALVTAGDADTTEATITQVWKYTAVRGGVIPVRNSTELAAIPAASNSPALAVQMDESAGEELKINLGSGWKVISQGNSLGPIAVADHTSESHAEGKHVYNTTTDKLYVSDGSNWRLVAMGATGTEIVTPTSVAGTGVSLSGAEVAVAAATSIKVNGVFTTAYDNHLVLWSAPATASSPNPLMRVCTAGSSDSGNNYDDQYLTAIGTNVSSAQLLAQSSWSLGIGSRDMYDSRMIFKGAALAEVTRVQVETFATDNPMGSTDGIAFRGLSHRGTTAIDGFEIFAATPGDTFTGKLRVYGYTNG